MPIAFDVAHDLLAISMTNGDGPITNLKMQKLLYYAQGWHLFNFGGILFPDTIEAWELGPVVPSVYHEFKNFKNAPIDYELTGDEEAPFSDDQKTFLVEFYSVYGALTATEMVTMTHNERPWIEAWNSFDKKISIKTMREYFSALYDKSVNEQKQI